MHTFNQAAAFFGNLAAGGYRASLGPVLTLLGEAVQKEVKIEIGEYQSAIGPFGSTAPLADATLERKSRYGLGKGGNADTPLWSTGDYHDSISYVPDIRSLSVTIGTPLDYIAFHELGTASMPPRPIFGPAALRALPPLKRAVAEAAMLGIAGGVWGQVAGLTVEGVTFGAGQDRSNILP